MSKALLDMVNSRLHVPDFVFTPPSGPMLLNSPRLWIQRRRVLTILPPPTSPSESSPGPSKLRLILVDRPAAYAGGRLAYPVHLLPIAALCVVAPVRFGRSTLLVLRPRRGRLRPLLAFVHGRAAMLRPIACISLPMADLRSISRSTRTPACTTTRARIMAAALMPTPGFSGYYHTHHVGKNVPTAISSMRLYAASAPTPTIAPSRTMLADVPSLKCLVYVRAPPARSPRASRQRSAVFTGTAPRRLLAYRLHLLPHAVAGRPPSSASVAAHLPYTLEGCCRRKHVYALDTSPKCTLDPHRRPFAPRAPGARIRAGRIALSPSAPSMSQEETLHIMGVVVVEGFTEPTSPRRCSSTYADPPVPHGGGASDSAGEVLLPKWAVCLRSGKTM
ncbi:hypothetical protein FB451DRAFT_1409031 [Mycena latifolia]|nr:hypothetical protein FB451DRAFT_1409031 [Mycena latifolia]